MGQAITKPSPREHCRNTCISDKIWRLAEKRVAVIRLPKRYQRLLRELDQEVQAILQKDMNHLAETAEVEAEDLLTSEPTLVK